MSRAGSYDYIQKKCINRQIHMTVCSTKALWYYVNISAKLLRKCKLDKKFRNMDVCKHSNLVVSRETYKQCIIN
jgi:hypothetical protein